MVRLALPRPSPPELQTKGNVPVSRTNKSCPCYYQSGEARLYTFSQETKDHLRKFRLGTSRANDPQAVICMYVFPLRKGAARLDSLDPRP